MKFLAYRILFKFKELNFVILQFLQEPPPECPCNITLLTVLFKVSTYTLITCCLLWLLGTFISLMFCSKQCREVALYELQLYIIPHSIPQGRTHIWHWGQCHIHNLLCICLWLPPTIVDTDFIFTVSKTESAAILHHLFHVSSKTVCFHIVFFIVLCYWGFHSFAVRIQVFWVVMLNSSGFDSWYFKGMYLWCNSFLWYAAQGDNPEDVYPWYVSFSWYM